MTKCYTLACLLLVSTPMLSMADAPCKPSMTVQQCERYQARMKTINNKYESMKEDMQNQEEDTSQPAPTSAADNFIKTKPSSSKNTSPEPTPDSAEETDDSNNNDPFTTYF